MTGLLVGLSEEPVVGKVGRIRVVRTEGLGGLGWIRLDWGMI